MHKNELSVHRIGSVLKMRQGAADFAARELPLREHKLTMQTARKRSKPTGSAETATAENRIYEMQVRICKALANHTRLHILDLLGKKSYTVSGLQRELGIPLANVSVQLATLRAAGVVATEKKGKEVHCSLALPEVRQACHFIRRVLKAQVRNAQNLPI
jgi:DNA-binding transcriptional ArsR family regulator